LDIASADLTTITSHFYKTFNSGCKGAGRKTSGGPKDKTNKQQYSTKILTQLSNGGLEGALNMHPGSHINVALLFGNTLFSEKLPSELLGYFRAKKLCAQFSTWL